MKKLIVLLGIIALANLTMGQTAMEIMTSKGLFKRCLTKEWVYISGENYYSCPLSKSLNKEFRGDWYFEYRRECDDWDSKFNLVFRDKKLIMLSFSYKYEGKYTVAALDMASGKIFTRDSCGYKTVPGYCGKLSEAGDSLAKIFWKETNYFLQGLLEEKKHRQQ